MADFCKACGEATFGPGYNDAKGLTSQDDWARGLAAVFLCEGCGFIQVDPEGNCVSPDCLCAGQAGHGLAQHGEPRADPACPVCGGCGAIGVDENAGIPGAEPYVVDDVCPRCHPAK